MKTYARHRTSTEVKALAAMKGFTVDSTKYDAQGYDHIVVHMPGPSRTLIPVLYNTVNGRFFHASANVVDSFTSDNPKLDGQPWFDAMLEFFYVEPVTT